MAFFVQPQACADRGAAPSQRSVLDSVVDAYAASLAAIAASSDDVAEDHPLWQAHDRWVEIIDRVELRGMSDVLAKCRAAKITARLFDGSEDPTHSVAERWAWQAVSALLRLQDGHCDAVLPHQSCAGEGSPYPSRTETVAILNALGQQLRRKRDLGILAARRTTTARERGDAPGLPDLSGYQRAAQAEAAANDAAAAAIEAIVDHPVTTPAEVGAKLDALRCLLPELDSNEDTETLAIASALAEAVEVLSGMPVAAGALSA